MITSFFLTASNNTSMLGNPKQVTASPTNTIYSKWKLLCDEKEGSDLKPFKSFRLYNEELKTYLETSSGSVYNNYNCGMNCPIKNHFEVYGGVTKNNKNYWMIYDGYFFEKQTQNKDVEYDDWVVRDKYNSDNRETETDL